MGDRVQYLVIKYYGHSMMKHVVAGHFILGLNLNNYFSNIRASE